METDVTAVVRVTPGVHWHALEDDVVVGKGHALYRPDGRVFLSVDTWRDDVFAVLADAMVSDLPGPVFTVVDDDDREVLARWSSRGFAHHRYEAEYVIPTSPHVTGLDATFLPPGVSVLGPAQVDLVRLRDLDRRLRDEERTPRGWVNATAQLLPPLADRAVIDTSPYLVAVQDSEYAGLLRITPLPRRPRLGLIAVRPRHRRHGLARALLAQAFQALSLQGVTQVSAEVDVANVPTSALFAGLGAVCTGGAVELVHQGRG